MKLIRAPGQQPPIAVNYPTTNQPVLQGTPKQGSQYSPSTAPASGTASSSVVPSTNSAIGVGVSNSVGTVPSPLKIFYTFVV